MAQPVKFEGANKVYKAPPGRDDVGDLHVFTNGNCIVSVWELTDAGWEGVVRTRRIAISSFSGDVLFPVFVGSERVTRSVVADYGKIW